MHISWHRWLLLLGGLYLQWNLISGLTTGSTRLVYGLVKRSDNALLYWCGIGFSAVFGAGALLAFLFAT